MMMVGPWDMAMDVLMVVGCWLGCVVGMFAD
jgi:hypothetical protein